VATETGQNEPADLAIPEAPWLRTRKKRVRAQLSRDTIVDAALRLLDREGARGLSMRRIAEELGCGAGAIYWHVENKEQLIQLVFDRVIAELPLPDPDPDPARWREQVKDGAHAERDAMRRHPGIAELSFGRIPVGPNAMRYFEWHLALMRAGGLSDRVAALAGDLMHLYIGAFAYEESVGMRTPTGAGPADFIAEMRAYLASLPPERFPNLAGLADEITRADSDERFDFAIDVLLEGFIAISKRD
jgi:TetR/AcrR family tetracycline transcriptional repressor